jgi:N-acetylglucosaminyldiphosphoundecaprenol N-acetyl-beta-D-mannosaminyltransferase
MPKIISLIISTGAYSYFIDRILELARKKQSSYICVANVHMTIEAYWDSKYADMVNDADLVTPDGMPLAKAMKLFYGLRQDRVAGMDLLPDLLEKAEKKISVFSFMAEQMKCCKKRKLLFKQLILI